MSKPCVVECSRNSGEEGTRCTGMVRGRPLVRDALNWVLVINGLGQINSR